jgi:hypothetical protein
LKVFPGSEKLKETKRKAVKKWKKEEERWLKKEWQHHGSMVTKMNFVLSSFGHKHMQQALVISAMGDWAEVNWPAAEGPGDQEAAVERNMKAASFLMSAMPNCQISKHKQG